MRWRIQTAAGALVLVAASGLATGATINVPGDQATIQLGIDAAVNGDEVVVNDGIYIENIDFMGKSITVRSVNGPSVTTIDANSNSVPVVNCVSGEGADTVLTGFTITGASGNSKSLGMNIVGSSPTVQNCVFTGISSNSTCCGGTQGAGLNMSGSSPVIQNCTFSNNMATGSGGGMYIVSGSSPIVAGCMFQNNNATGSGGAMYVSGGSPIVTDCSFEGNTANGSGGGLYLSQITGKAVFMNCFFMGNVSSNDNGGGAFLSQTEQGSVLVDCQFDGNSADGNGGGLYRAGGRVVNCTFKNNAAVFGGGIYNTRNEPISDCLLAENMADDGGGIYNTVRDVLMERCTLTENTATFGAGMLNTVDGATVRGFILWNNHIGGSFGGPGLPLVSYSIVDGGFPGTKIITGDPLFVDPSNGDFRLQAGSPAIDAGYFNVGPLLDLDGNPRAIDVQSIINTGAGFQTFVDMGPYEFQSGGSVPADFDDDGDVDGVDFAAFAACFNKAGNPPRTLGCPQN